jgi:hypothetical protein
MRWNSTLIFFGKPLPHFLGLIIKKAKGAGLFIPIFLLAKPQKVFPLQSLLQYIAIKENIN